MNQAALYPCKISTVWNLVSMPLVEEYSNSSQKLLYALQFAANAHKAQRRKYDGSPYINHLIEVANLLASKENIADSDVLIASLLHDILEDTPVSHEELTELFGRKVADLVSELTDDKTLTLQERRDKQIRELPAKSIEYKAIKLADHCSNISAIPESWEPERVKAYREWSWSIAELCVDACTHLEKEYKKRYGATSRIQVRPSL